MNHKKSTVIVAIDLGSHQMTEVIIIAGSILAVIGIGVAVWSIISTRKRYYEDYMRRKRRADD